MYVFLAYARLQDRKSWKKERKFVCELINNYFLQKDFGECESQPKKLQFDPVTVNNYSSHQLSGILLAKERGSCPSTLETLSTSRSSVMVRILFLYMLFYI